MSTSFQRRTRALFLLVLTVPLLVGSTSFLVAARHRITISDVSHTKDVLVQIEDILDAMVRAESNQRGFLLTAKRNYAVNYLRIKERIHRQLAELRTATADNPAQRKNIVQLSALIDKRLDEIQNAILLPPPRSIATDQAVFRMEQGSKMMRDIRAQIRIMHGEENRLLLQRINAEKGNQSQVFICSAVGVLLNIILLYWAYRSTIQYGSSRDLAEFEIRQLNVKLEKRVQERTAELESANEQLRRSNEDLSRFAHVASHDLQEPLRTVGSYAGLLGRRYEGKLDEQADKYIRFVVDGAKRMQILVQDLLEYSRAGTQALSLARVDLNVIVQHAKDNLRLAIAERHAQIVSGPLPSIDADAGKLVLVFQNLIGNSLKFSKPDQLPEITIEARREKDTWVISISDNGIGFEPEYTEKIFIIFQRLHQVGAYPGTGIGLAICKRIVEGHGGHISAVSRPGEGSTFSFTVPIIRRNFVLSAAESQALSWAGGSVAREQSGQNTFG